MTAYSKLDVDPANLDPDGIAESQALGAAGDVVLNGALCDSGTAAQFDIGDTYSSGVGGIRLLFDSSGDISTVNFTITGKDENGLPVTEVVTGVTTTAVSTTTYFSQVTQIAADAAAANLFIGTVTGELVTPTIPVNVHSANPAVVAVSGKTGTCQFDVQETYDNIGTASESQSATWIDILTDQSTDQASVATASATAVRLKLDSYSNGAELQFHVRYNPYR